MTHYLKKISKLQWAFLAAFILLNLYYLVIKEELYESRTLVLVRDLAASSAADTLGLSLLGVSTSSQLQDSKVVEESLMSLDVFTVLDKQFNLIEHFKSDQLDFIERLGNNATREEALDFYNKRLKTTYDETSGILYISYAHVDPKQAKAILEFLVSKVEEGINDFNRRRARKQLEFVEMEYEKAKKKMDVSSRFLESYQNRHLLLDPTTEATASSGMISELEATLTRKQIEYSTMQSYLNEESYELRALENEINEIKNSITNQRRELTGTSEQPLNKVLMEYEKLKLQLEFDTEVYKNALLQLETTKIDVSKAAKTLSVISYPNSPDGYTYPNKPKVFITILIVTLLLYGIVAMLNAIIKDHKE